jgi:hypothetical protein
MDDDRKGSTPCLRFQSIHCVRRLASFLGLARRSHSIASPPEFLRRLMFSSNDAESRALMGPKKGKRRNDFV